MACVSQRRLLRGAASVGRAARERERHREGPREAACTRRRGRGRRRSCARGTGACWCHPPPASCRTHHASCVTHRASCTGLAMPHALAPHAIMQAAAEERRRRSRSWQQRCARRRNWPPGRTQQRWRRGRAASLPRRSTATQKVRIANLYGLARRDREMALERGTNPKPQRRTCSSRHGVSSCRGESAGVA
jgi:hypothetical protein